MAKTCATLPLGWIDRHGTLHPCDDYQHSACFDELEEQGNNMHGWVHVGTIADVYIYSDSMYRAARPTQSQIDKLADIACETTSEYLKQVIYEWLAEHSD